MVQNELQMGRDGLELLTSLIKENCHFFCRSIIFFGFVLQTWTTVLITIAVMVDRVKMVSTVIPVTAREDILGIAVKQVKCCSC